MGEPSMFVERYRVVPAVDVEALRTGLRTTVDRGTARVAFGPSLLGTLDMDALPPGMHPFVDPDRAVLPLRDDVVLLVPPGDADPAALLDGTATRVERAPLVAPPSSTAAQGVLVLVRATADDDVEFRWSLAPDPVQADRVLAGLLVAASGSPTAADLYVVLPQALLDSVLAPRDR